MSRKAQLVVFLGSLVAATACGDDDGGSGFECLDEHTGVIGGRTYLLCLTEVEWDTAQGYCVAQGGYLATIEDETENAAVGDLMEPYIADDGGPGGWIGGRRVGSSDEWEWASTENPVGYTNWSSGEPNNEDGVENCVEMKPSGDWNDHPCSSSQAFVCEIP